jgi:outer membrane protein
VATKVGAVLTSYAQAQGFTLVLDGGTQQAPVVLYASASTDITKAIVDAYNVKSGVPPPPAEPASTTPKSTLPSAPKPAPKAPTGAH